MRNLVILHQDDPNKQYLWAQNYIFLIRVRSLDLVCAEIYQHFSRRPKVVQELCQSQLQTYAQTCIPTPVKYLGEANIISLGICVLLWCPSIPPLLLV